MADDRFPGITVLSPRKNRFGNGLRDSPRTFHLPALSLKREASTAPPSTSQCEDFSPKPPVDIRPPVSARRGRKESSLSSSGKQRGQKGRSGISSPRTPKMNMDRRIELILDHMTTIGEGAVKSGAEQPAKGSSFFSAEKEERKLIVASEQEFRTLLFRKFLGLTNTKGLDTDRPGSIAFDSLAEREANIRSTIQIEETKARSTFPSFERTLAVSRRKKIAESEYNGRLQIIREEIEDRKSLLSRWLGLDDKSNVFGTPAKAAPSVTSHNLTPVGGRVMSADSTTKTRGKSPAKDAVQCEVNLGFTASKYSWMDCLEGAFEETLEALRASESCVRREVAAFEKNDRLFLYKRFKNATQRRQNSPRRAGLDTPSPRQSAGSASPPSSLASDTLRSLLSSPANQAAPSPSPSPAVERTTRVVPAVVPTVVPAFKTVPTAAPAEPPPTPAPVIPVSVRPKAAQEKVPAALAQPVPVRAQELGVAPAPSTLPPSTHPRSVAAMTKAERALAVVFAKDHALLLQREGTARECLSRIRDLEFQRILFKQCKETRICKFEILAEEEDIARYALEVMEYNSYMTLWWKYYTIVLHARRR